MRPRLERVKSGAQGEMRRRRVTTGKSEGRGHGEKRERQLHRYTKTPQEEDFNFMAF